MSDPDYRVRRLTKVDSALAAEWYMSHRPLTGSLKSGLDSLFKKLIGEKVLIAASMERYVGSDQSCQSVAFGLAGFLTEEYARLCSKDPIVFFDLHLLERCGKGEVNQCFLSRREVARKSADGGLDLIILCWLQDSFDFKTPHGRKMLKGAYESIGRFLRGYRLNSVVIEGWEKNEEAFKVGGFVNFTRFPVDLMSANLRTQVNRSRLQAHIALSDIGKLLPGSPVSLLFADERPNFGLSQDQQDVVEFALDGLSDEEIANCLGVKKGAVQMRWRRIYEKILDIKPDIIDEPDKQVRGREKRRKVLKYLGEHPEELRPYNS